MLGLKLIYVSEKGYCFQKTGDHQSIKHPITLWFETEIKWICFGIDGFVYIHACM